MTISIDGTLKDTIGVENPFRYRGYYYDTELGLYYLNSSYYDPEYCRFINADGFVSTGYGLLETNMYIYCLNNPIVYSDPNGYCVRAWEAGYMGPCPGQGLPGCMDNMPQFKYSSSNNGDKIDKKSPPDHPAYKAPKANKGGARQVKEPNGNRKGWIAKDGGVWVPDDGMHGGAGWTVEYPDGSHWHAYPGGGIRKAEKQSNPVVGTVMIVIGVAMTAYLIANDITGFGAADDGAVPATAGCVVAGWDQINGMYVCECGESWYEH